ncbi:MAG: hypothetical protein QOE61_2600 [Micromonosporaceae bacterium]|nr:hypothetical protein [Micromonosporaceae bacterium]
MQTNALAQLLADLRSHLRFTAGPLELADQQLQGKVLEIRGCQVRRDAGRFVCGKLVECRRRYRCGDRWSRLILKIGDRLRATCVGYEPTQCPSDGAYQRCLKSGRHVPDANKLRRSRDRPRVPFVARNPHESQAVA